MSGLFSTILAAQVGACTICGVPSGFDGALCADIARQGGLHIFVARDDAHGQAIADIAKFFAPELKQWRLPAFDCLPYDRVGPAVEISARRIHTLLRLARLKPDHPPILLITTAAALLQRTLPPMRLRKAAMVARPGQDIDLERLTQYFATNGYGRASSVREKGDFAMRGGVVDFFAPSANLPIRLDLFGDTVETIRAFDPETQRSLKPLKGVELAPVSEVLLDKVSIAQFKAGYLNTFGPGHSDPLYETVSLGGRRGGLEHWLSLFYEQTATLFDYLGENAHFYIDDATCRIMDERWQQIEDYYAARKNPPMMKGAVPYKALEPENAYLPPKQVLAGLANHDCRHLSAEIGDGPIDGHKDAPSLNAGVTANPDFRQNGTREPNGQNVWDRLVAHLADLSAQGRFPLLAAWSAGSADRLGHVLSDHGAENLVRINDMSALGTLKNGDIGLTILPLDQGFAMGPNVLSVAPKGLDIYSEADILGARLSGSHKRKRANKNVILEAAGLDVDDLIVHVDHGIGRYAGLRTIDVQNAPHDCLELIYAGGDKLLLPVENIELISRYGADDSSAMLDRLGGGGWQTRKARAKKRLMDMAEGLIAIAAAREAKTASQITPPQALYDEFCARFPFQETDDQLNAIDDVFADLASGRPMDRLICGDVGFGKTEVALRAAFVTAMSGRQVALVCPTTLLARQHYATFVERFRGWPVHIRQLSRLVGSKEQKDTKDALADGKIEIVIGTHALLGKDIAFADLGMVIVDEEQHFGVKHKEKLKELRHDTHVLTLSATPIPRTLQLSLAGIRDMSIIATPPVDRLAVRTYITPWDPIVIREALLREKYRGGQMFVVAPRIEHLDEIERFLREHVPEISFVVAHGQMAATKLEEIITHFYEGGSDALVATSIVESGLDIPRANSLVVWRADLFGLAQLYQLRGRVGRSKSRAYAYLTTPSNFDITKQAEKRLKVLHSLDSLGAGFLLASHDLDLRGGGNLLGEEQSGHIREVGAELYQQMLEDAVANQRGDIALEDRRSWSPSINLGVPVLIPDHYVPDLTVRLSLYRRLADVEKAEARDAWAAELADRFGPIPEEVRHLLAIAEIKAACRLLGIAKFDSGPKGAVITFRPKSAPDPTKLIGLVQAYPTLFKMRPDGKMIVLGQWPGADMRLKATKQCLKLLLDATGLSV